jgi:hypothetical protein
VQGINELIQRLLRHEFRELVTVAIERGDFDDLRQTMQRELETSTRAFVMEEMSKGGNGDGGGQHASELPEEYREPEGPPPKRRQVLWSADRFQTFPRLTLRVFAKTIKYTLLLFQCHMEDKTIVQGLPQFHLTRFFVHFLTSKALPMSCCFSDPRPLGHPLTPICATM